METFSDFAPLAAFLVSGLLKVNKQDYDALKLDQDQIKQIFQFTLWHLETVKDWQRDKLFQDLKTLAETMDIKLKDFLAPLFLAISGTTATFSVMDAMVLLGPDLTRARIRHSLNSLFGDLGKKQLKKLEKTYRTLAISSH